MRTFLVVLLLAGVDARAAPTFSIELFRPAVDSQGLVTVNAAQTLPHLGWSIGLVGDYAFDPLVLRSAVAAYRVEHLVTMQLQAALGLFGGDRFRNRLHGVAFQLGVTVPVHVLAGARSPDDHHFSAQSIGDVGLSLKTRLLEDGHRRVGLGLLLAVDLPSDRGAALLGEGQTTFRPSVIADKQLGRVQLALNVGALVRSGHHTFTDTTTSLSRMAGTTLTYSLGISVAVVRQRLALVGEVFGSHDFYAGVAGNPVEVALAAKVYLATSSYFEIGAAAGALPGRIADGSTMTGLPTARTFVGFVFEPHLVGRSSGEVEEAPVRRPPPPAPPVADADAEAPEREIDTDTPIPDEPKPVRVVRTKGAFKTFEKVYFRTASAEILPRSFPLLDDVAKLLVDNPDVKRLEIAGHADERGDDAYNLRLTEARAQSVRRYLVERGIAPQRLVARGYGETQPAQDPRTLGDCVEHGAYCWEKNRRVEFRILDEPR